MVLNLVALWKQEARDPARTRSTAVPAPAFRDAWRSFIAQPARAPLPVAVGLGTAAFSMQDILLEPYGGEILQPVASARPRALTALLAGGALVALRARGAPARPRRRPVPPRRRSARWSGVVAFAAVIFAAPLDSALLFRAGAVLIGFGGGLFAVGTLTAAMGLERADGTRAWRSAPGAPCRRRPPGCRDRAAAARCATSSAAWPRRARSARRWPARSTGYSVVYHLEIALLFATLVAIGPLVRATARPAPQPPPPQVRPGRVPRLDAVTRKEDHHGNRRHHRVHRRRAARALRVLDLLRGPDLLPARARTSARATRSRPTTGRGVIAQGWPPMPEPKTFLLAARRRRHACPTPTPSPQTLTRRAGACAGPARRWSRPATRCSTASARAPTPTAPTCPT